MSSPPTKVWEHPDISSTQIESFRKLANERHGLNLRDYHDLWRWSTEKESLNDFWLLLWEFTQVRASVHPTYAITASETSRLTPTPTWFPEARLNFAQNILESAYAPADHSATPVLTAIREGAGEIEHVSLSQLRRRVGRLSNALTRAGVRKLDRVAFVGANSIDTFVALLAAAAIGATFTCCSPEMGEKGILDRFLQVKPKVLFADDWVLYNGKRIPCLEKAKKVAVRLRRDAGLQDLIVVPRFGGDSLNLNRAQSDSSFHTLDSFTAGAPDDLTFAQLEFAHPLVVVYSSGTTGQPKCLVHTLGGVLLKQKVEQILGIDMTRSSVYLQYTTTNWIMYLYSVSGLLSGARSILYDGSPVKPSPLILLQILAAQRVTHFGTSAHYLSLLEQAGISKRDLPAGLDALKVITSTGSVLTEPQYYWVYKTFGPVQLSSIAGGTDIAGAFVHGTPSLPIYAGWCQARALGMKVQIFSDDGEPIEATGEPGELVCTAPFPSQPAFFWGDEGGKRYKAAYFERFPGIWHQGDYIRMDPATQGIAFLGRSDGVLNPSGVRFGSAEIYNTLNIFSSIEDSLCVGQRRPQDRDERVLLFVKMKPGHTLDHKLKKAIETRIRQDLSPRHVPKFIFETPDIPITVNGKKTELPVKKIVSGQSITPSSTIANPASLKWYEQFARLDGDGVGGAKVASKL
ncbi:acetoacetate-CoA ligase [Capronia epimyces CBS 606.96]|uniref:Acetoacetate-CoA ligase n=1 Tax=Capronia epimyces CBS 606.96 TaxID=1182542 RepID=W9YC14_9EURO|nr:acetoacetate-CoA ligase [Capronia epimyces CBS 606.96]EXJ87220.1 acetoacetate-CoA ligase [Capronia epimyces CBS 606.96]